jgi:hypothetical protein
MVVIDLKTGVVSGDKNEIFGKKKAKTVKRKRTVVRRKGATAKRNKTGGSVLGKLRGLGKYFTFRRSAVKDDVVYKVTRNDADTADVFSVVKNGKVTHEKEVEDSKLSNIFTRAKESVFSFFKKSKTDVKSGGGMEESEEGMEGIFGGAGDFIPGKMDIAENTNTYSYIYKLRGPLDISFRVFTHIIMFLLFFCVIYIVIFGASYLIRGHVPFSVFRKYVVINGKEIPT